MKAQDMFKELGYDNHKYSDLNHNNFKPIEVIFTKNMEIGSKQIVICNEGSYTYRIFDVENFEQEITTMGEHQAIHQQMKELGWLDE